MSKEQQKPNPIELVLSHKCQHDDRLETYIAEQTDEMCTLLQIQKTEIDEEEQLKQMLPTISDSVDHVLDQLTICEDALAKVRADVRTHSNTLATLIQKNETSMNEHEEKFGKIQGLIDQIHKRNQESVALSRTVFVELKNVGRLGKPDWLGRTSYIKMWSDYCKRRS